MSLAGCSNLNSWVRGLDEKVESVLAKRLEKVGREQWFGPSTSPPPTFEKGEEARECVKEACFDLLYLASSTFCLRKRKRLENVYREPWFDLLPHLLILSSGAKRICSLMCTWSHGLTCCLNSSYQYLLSEHRWVLMVAARPSYRSCIYTFVAVVRALDSAKCVLSNHSDRVEATLHSRALVGSRRPLGAAAL